MRLITEEVVKKIILAGKFVEDGKLCLPADCMLTPSAKAAVIDCKLTLVQEEECEHDECGATKDAAPLASRTSENEGTKHRYKTAEGEALNTKHRCKTAEGEALSTRHRYKTAEGEALSTKPEHMTLLQGNLLVCKDDARIFLRGEIDILIAELLKTQLCVAQRGCQSLVDELEDMYGFIGKLSRAEVLDEPFDVATVIGLSYTDVQEMSHHPRRYFNRGHLFNISYQDGEFTLLLNALRALSRRCELMFYKAFKAADGSVARPDLMEGFNRLSSLFYILCLRASTGTYEDMR